MQGNPFSSNRVDSPFQRYADLGEIYSTEFNILSHLLQEVRSELNHQSRGAVVIGEAGTGKSHLMMRLAQTHLKTNRLLFVSQPNNADSVFYHIYCCVLESLFQLVLDSQYNQLEYLIANTFVRIVQTSETHNRSAAGQNILDTFAQNPLSMYSKISKEDTPQHRKTWDYIEKQTLSWWSNAYGAGGFGLAVLQGIVKFCRYRDIKKRETVRRWLSGQPMLEKELEAVGLPNWEEELSRESFALHALRVLGRLSILDEPLIFVFDQLEGLWLRHPSLLLSFGDVIKEFITHVPNCLVILNLFPDRWREFNRSFDASITERITAEVWLNRPADAQLWQILQLRTAGTGLNLEEFFTTPERSEILSQSSIRGVLRRASQYFQHKKYQLPLPPLVRLEPIPTTLEERVEKLERTVAELQNSPVSQTEEETSIVDLFGSPETENSSKIEDEITGYIKLLETKIKRNYDPGAILSESDDIGKLQTIAEVFPGKFNISSLPLRWRNVPDNILLEWETKSYAIGFLYGSLQSFASRIKRWNLLLIDLPDTQFILVRDIREPAIKGTAEVCVKEIEKLNQRDNGKYKIMDKTDRVYFELCYQLIVDVQNRDLDASIPELIDALTSYIPSYWLVQILTS